MAWLYVILAIIVIALVIVIANLKIVPQSKAYVIERLGAYLTTWQTGFHVKIPFFERIAKVVSLKEQVVDFAPQPVITKDNVTMQIDTVATVYKGNIIKNLIMDCQSYTKYRPNETTGGIFVSWRRKEELPTGA